MTRREPKNYDWDKLDFDEAILPAKPNRIHHPRRQKIFGVTVHHMAMVGHGSAALTACSNAWAKRPASAHYGVSDDGQVRQYVWDGDEAWACANSQGNQGTISIEHVNSKAAPTWEVAERTWRTGARLVAYLHNVYGLGRPVDGKTRRINGTLVRVSGTLFKHSDWYSTACCGPYLGGKIWDDYLAEAQRVYDEISSGKPAKPPTEAKPPARKSYKVVKGDTLTAIGRKYGATVNQLKGWNDIANANQIEVGQKLWVEA